MAGYCFFAKYCNCNLWREVRPLQASSGACKTKKMNLLPR